MDRAKRGSKRHLICDGSGVPLAIQLTGANRNDSQQALSLGQKNTQENAGPGENRTEASKQNGDKDNQFLNHGCSRVIE
jgi:hypothetical protein